MKTTAKSMFMTFGVAATSLLLGGCPSQDAEYADNPPPATTAPPPVNNVATSGPCDQLNSAQAMSILASRAQTEMKGYEPEGSILCGNVPQGGAVDGQWFTLQPGMCYAVLAQGMGTVVEVDVAIMVDAAAMVGMPAGSMPGAQSPLVIDNSAGNQAYAGPCAKFPLGTFTMPARVQVKARNGFGPVAAQVYRKPG